jgi:FtsP/CotA-like multicopper oxidase with cupredoxin domain
MPKRSYLLTIAALLCLVPATRALPADQVLANHNRTPAGKLENGILNVQLEIRTGTWHPEAEDGPALYVQALGEREHPAEIPGPLLRMPEGTAVHATVTNKLKIKATVYGLNTRPADPSLGVEIPAGESREFKFIAGTPGTYYYWARTTEVFKVGERTIVQPVRADAQLNGAFIVDPAGPVVADRIFLINSMFAEADVVQQGLEVLSINGKSYPYTEPLEYTAGQSIRWRVINPSVAEHPMHLHGSFYQLLSLGDFAADTSYGAADRQSVVTQNLRGGTTMMLEWTPAHAGRWLFHCHYHYHVSSDERIPVWTRTAPEHYADDAPAATAAHQEEMSGMPEMSAMKDMAGLILTINVKPSGSPAPPPAAARATRNMELLIEPSATEAKPRTFFCSLREGENVTTSEEKSVAPPLVVTRGEPVEITVVNHLQSPTTIHWHGIELDSYYDGVIGGGTGDQLTPAIQPGDSFVARFTPNRAGTFIYHTHSADPRQLTGGLYGALIVLEPGQSFDPVHDRLLVIGSHDPSFYTKHITLNGSEEFAAPPFDHNATYRLRVINMAPNLSADLQIGTADHLATWRPISKDGADLPSRLSIPGDAQLHIASGETYDFEFRPTNPGQLPIEVENSLNRSKLTATLAIQ